MGLMRCATRFAIIGLAFTASGCAGVMMGAGVAADPAAYIDGTHQPLVVQVSPQSAVCDVAQGDALVGTIRHGAGKVILAKGRETVSVKCAAMGYETKTVAVQSFFPLYGAFHCVTDGLCEPAVRSGRLHQYPTRLDLALTAVRPSPARKLAAAKARDALAMMTAAPVPAVTPTPVAMNSDIVSFKRLPPLPPAVQALRVGKPQTAEPVAIKPRTRVPEAAKPPVIDAPLGTWRTTANGARAWWGRDVPHSLTMPSTALLSLQRTRGDWGLFDYLGEDGTRGRVWIALNDVRLAE